MTKNKECAEREDILRKQNMWQLFSSPKQTLVPKNRMLKLFVLLWNLFPEYGMTTRYQNLALDILTQSYYIIHDTSTSHPPAHTHTHLLPLLPQRQDMNVSVPPRQFSFNGPPDNLLFSSVLLVWPLAQSLPQPSTKTQDLSPLSGEGCCKKRKNRTGYHCGITWILNIFQVFLCFLYWIWHCSVLDWTEKIKLCWQLLFIGTDKVFILFLMAYIFVACGAGVFRLPAFIHHIYWLPLLAFSAV